MLKVRLDVNVLNLATVPPRGSPGPLTTVEAVVAVGADDHDFAWGVVEQPRDVVRLEAAGVLPGGSHDEPIEAFVGHRLAEGVAVGASAGDARVDRYPEGDRALFERAALTVTVTRAGRLPPEGTFTTRRYAAERGTRRLTGRLDGRALSPGRYVLRASATDAASNHSRKALTRFRIAAP